MLFQFADANLQTYWDANTPQWNRETWLWAITQMKGLASGLEMIHNFKIRHPLRPDIFHSTVTSRRPQFSGVLQANAEEEKFGRHGDLKPENILFFRRSGLNDPLGILQIADFGLSRFHRLESRSMVDPRVNGSPTYSPPEIYLGELVSRAYDIWSMGCVYLQFVTWLLEGPVGLTDFTNTRMERNDVDVVEDDVFYTPLLLGDVKKAEIRSGVRLWIEYLRKSPACSGFIKDMLDLVQHRMLLISTKDRIDAKGLNSTLRGILIQAQEDSYLLGRDAPLMATEKLQNGDTATNGLLY
jgi:serine/threonine protein kinase